MENITNQVLDLANGKKYFVLRQAVYKGVTYFLGAELTPDEEDFTNNFAFLERIDDGDDLKIKKVTDKAIIDILAKNIKIE
jgi:ketosteroid isomerase-like protein